MVVMHTFSIIYIESTVELFGTDLEILKQSGKLVKPLILRSFCMYP